MAKIKTKDERAAAVFEAVVDEPSNLAELVAMDQKIESGDLSAFDAAKSRFFGVFLEKPRQWLKFTKNQMIEIGNAHGISVFSSMTKAEIDEELNALDPALDDMTKQQLYEYAKSKRIYAVTRMTKAEIIAAIKAAEGV